MAAGGREKKRRYSRRVERERADRAAKGGSSSPDQPVPLGFRIVICTRQPDTFAAARAERLKVSGNPGQYDNLVEFIREQEVLRAIVARSLLPSLEVDVSHDNIALASDRIADWLEATGGLTVPVEA